MADDPYNAVRFTLVVARVGFSGTGFTVNYPLDNRVNTGLIKVLYDKTCVIRPYAKDATGYIPSAEEFEMDISCSVPIEYSSAAASTPVTQSIFLVVVSDSVAVVNPGFASASTLSMEFSDL